jgi:hypothetical protein
LALWEIADRLAYSKTYSHRARYFPLGLLTLGAWDHAVHLREFSFALHQIQQAIEADLSLQQTLSSWNQIAQALAEKSRDRLLQLTNGIPSDHRFNA